MADREHRADADALTKTLSEGPILGYDLRVFPLQPVSNDWSNPDPRDVAEELRSNFQGSHHGAVRRGDADLERRALFISLVLCVAMAPPVTALSLVPTPEPFSSNTRGLAFLYLLLRASLSLFTFRSSFPSLTTLLLLLLLGDNMGGQDETLLRLGLMLLTGWLVMVYVHPRVRTGEVRRRVERFLFGWEFRPPEAGWRYREAILRLNRSHIGPEPWHKREVAAGVDPQTTSDYLSLLSNGSDGKASDGAEDGPNTKTRLYTFAGVSAVTGAAMDGWGAWLILSTQGSGRFAFGPELLCATACWGATRLMGRREAMFVPGLAILLFLRGSMDVGSTTDRDLIVWSVSFSFASLILRINDTLTRLRYSLMLAKACQFSHPSISIGGLFGQSLLMSGAHKRKSLCIREDEVVERRLEELLGRMLERGAPKAGDRTPSSH